MHSLTYLRIATKSRDGADGFLYRHDFGTGYQELVFASHDKASEWAGKLNN